MFLSAQWQTNKPMVFNVVGTDRCGFFFTLQPKVGLVASSAICRLSKLSFIF
jgi:hypothetical protein